MDLLEDLEMSLLSFNFVIIYIIHKMLILLKNHLNFLKDYTPIKDITNLFKLEKETKVTEDRILRDIKNFFEHEEENYYKPQRVSNFWSNNYTDDRKKPLSVEEYLNRIRSYLKDIINNLKKSGKQKIQLTIVNNFISSTDSDEEHVMHSKSDNIEIKINDEADKVIKELFDSLKNRYQNNSELLKDSESVFDYVHLLYYKCHKINRNRSRSYVNSPYSIVNKKATLNPINKNDNKCFQYAVTVALNHEGIGKHSERITKMKLFINEYKQKGISFASQKDDRKKIERNNVTIALNVLYVKKEKI